MEVELLHGISNSVTTGFPERFISDSDMVLIIDELPLLYTSYLVAPEIAFQEHSTLAILEPLKVKAHVGFTL
jgi:hypothetical protein